MHYFSFFIGYLNELLFLYWYILWFPKATPLDAMTDTQGANEEGKGNKKSHRTPYFETYTCYSEVTDEKKKKVLGVFLSSFISIFVKGSLSYFIFFKIGHLKIKWETLVYRVYLSCFSINE